MQAPIAEFIKEQYFMGIYIKKKIIGKEKISYCRYKHKDDDDAVQY